MTDPTPRARRLPTPRWLDGRLVLGVLLVLLSVVVGARIFAASDHYAEVYVARHALTPGERLGPADLSVGRVRFDGEGARYVAATDRAPVGYVVTHYVGADEFVPLDAVTAAADRISASRDVTVPVASGHLPVGLGRGDLVDVYVTAKHGATGAVPPPTQVLATVPVESAGADSAALSGSSTDAVVLTVPVAQVSDMVHAVESGDIDLVRVPQR